MAPLPKVGGVNKIGLDAYGENLAGILRLPAVKSESTVVLFCFLKHLCWGDLPTVWSGHELLFIAVGRKNESGLKAF